MRRIATAQRDIAAAVGAAVPPYVLDMIANLTALPVRGRATSGLFLRRGAAVRGGSGGDGDASTGG